MDERIENRNKYLLSWAMVTSLLVEIGGFIFLIIWDENVSISFASKRFIFLSIYWITAGIIAVWIFWNGSRSNWKYPQIRNAGKNPTRYHRIFAYFFLALPAILFSVISFFNIPYFSWIGLSILMFCSTLATIVLYRDKDWKALTKNWGVLILVACVSFLVGKELNSISSYPFSMGWSETSRYYLASLTMDKTVYGIDLPLPHRNLSRYLMQSIPFLFSGAGLWAHRFWEGLLQIVLPFLASFFLVRRFSLDNKKKKAFAILWGGLFIQQGPVFYPMLVIMILIFSTFDSKHLWRSTFWILLTSIWAGITRVNWIPMPALIAIMIYLMENRNEVENRASRIISYFSYPFFWGVSGILAGLLSQQWYQENSGLPADIFSTDLSSDLLWYRLLPNITYSPGILVGILAITFPILLYIILNMNANKKILHPLNRLSIWAIIASLFLGGVVVSTKIGGGTNLHNMDVFIVALYVIGSYLYFEYVDSHKNNKTQKPGFLIGLILLIPVLIHGLSGSPFSIQNYLVPEDHLQRLQGYVDEYKDKGEVLFIAERHLLTFGLIENVDFVNDYEKIILMEMTMGRNMNYLERFYQDLKTQKFSMIVSDIIKTSLKDPMKSPLAEENNINAELISKPITCYYSPLEIFSEVGFMVWVPLNEPIC